MRPLRFFYVQQFDVVEDFAAGFVHTKSAQADGVEHGYGLVAGLRWVYLRYRDIEALGLGDGALLAMVGACCGAKGVLWTVAAGAIQALVIAVPLLVFGKKVASSELQEVHGDDPALGQDGDGVMGARVPFGPFLAVAALEYVLIPEQIDALVGLFAP